MSVTQGDEDWPCTRRECIEKCMLTCRWLCLPPEWTPAHCTRRAPAATAQPPALSAGPHPSTVMSPLRPNAYNRQTVPIQKSAACSLSVAIQAHQQSQCWHARDRCLCNSKDLNSTSGQRYQPKGGVDGFDQLFPLLLQPQGERSSVDVLVLARFSRSALRLRQRLLPLHLLLQLSLYFPAINKMLSTEINRACPSADEVSKPAQRLGINTLLQ